MYCDLLAYPSTPRLQTEYTFYQFILFINQIKIQNTMKKILFLFVALILGAMGAKADVAPATSFTGYSDAPAGGTWAANTQWFMIKNTNENSGQNFYLTPSGNYLPTTLPTATNIDSYLWALVGDAENGFQLYNKAQGVNNILWVTNNSRGMSEAPTNSHVWDLYTSLDAGKFLIIEHGTEHNALNNAQQNGSLVSWNSEGALYGWQHTAANPTATGDGGSNFVISGAEEYTVVVNGLTEGGGVIIAGVNYGAGTVNTFSVLAEAATGVTVAGYTSTTSLDGHTITVTYEEADTYAPTFANQKHTNGNRQVSAIGLGDQSITINGAGNVYQNLTKTASFTVEAGATVTPSITWNGVWMHGMVYVDTDASDKVFTESECVSHTALSGSPDLATGFESFVAPAVGDYRMRYKVDWATLDPNGASDLIANGGYVIDLILHVTPAADKANVTYKYVVDGKEVKTIVNEQTIGEHAAAQPLAINATYADVTDDHAEKTVAADGSTVVTVTVAQHLPFQAYNGEGLPKYGLLNVHSNQCRILYAEYDAEGGKLWDTTDKTYRGDFKESGRVYNWCIEGNVVEGFKLFNGMGYVNVTAGNQATLAEEGTIFDLRPTTAGVGGRNFKNGFCLAIAGSNNFLNAQTKIQNDERTTGVKTWTSADAGSTFEFETAYDFSISDAGYATLFYHSPLQLPEGVTGYSVVREGDYLVATELENRFVPSATGVILKGAEGDYTATVTAAYGNAAIENNVLSGRYVNGTDGINDNTYVLNVKGEDAYFAKFTGSQLGEFKAYYQAPAESASNLRISFGELNSIISAAQENGGQAIFDLQGRRVVSAKGLYIVNGKKVIK